jgi:pimeloyl-ACP methyl ester carboxylesterase
MLPPSDGRRVMELSVRDQYVTTADGWSLALRRTVAPAAFNPASKPLLIVPGYGMNSFIFHFHPRGTSMVRTLAEAGYEVWALDMRGQGESRPENRRPGPASLRNYATIDVPAAVERVVGTTDTQSKKLILVGCSLGGSIAYGYLAATPKPRVAGMIAMGAPLRWTHIHPIIRAAFFSPLLARAVKITRTREMLKNAFPLVSRVRSLISLYMNPDTIDVSQLDAMTATVEDPDPRVNHDIALWMRTGDMSFPSRAAIGEREEAALINVTEALRHVKLPLLLVVPNKDGIVPEGTAMSAAKAWGGSDVEILRVGDDTNWYAHANLFVADDAPRLVFDPMIDWLKRH